MTKRSNYSGQESHRRHGHIEYLVQTGRASRWLPLRTIDETIRHLEEHS